jgi:hypothetical protein
MMKGIASTRSEPKTTSRFRSQSIRIGSANRASSAASTSIPIT